MERTIADVGDANVHEANGHLQRRTKVDSDIYKVVVFGSSNERAKFLKPFRFADNRYIDGRTLVKVFRDVAGCVKEAELAG